MAKGDRLGETENRVLWVLIRLGDSAYGVPIQRELQERTGRRLSYSALYTTLERMEKKGFVSSHWGESRPERGGKARKYFRIEAPGRAALAQVDSIRRQLEDGMVLDGVQADGSVAMGARPMAVEADGF